VQRRIRRYLVINTASPRRVRVWAACSGRYPTERIHYASEEAPEGFIIDWISPDGDLFRGRTTSSLNEMSSFISGRRQLMKHILDRLMTKKLDKEENA
jgi:hypothetical protein